MQTIRQAELERYPFINSEGEHSTHHAFCRSAFGFGVEFAEQWTPGEDELPSEENGYIGDNVLIKDADGIEAVGLYTIDEYWDSYDERIDIDNIISWRPINRK